MQRRWLVIVTLLVASALSAFVVPHPSAAPERPSACGEERWAVKALQDPAGKALDLSVIEKTTVAELRKLGYLTRVGARNALLRQMAGLELWRLECSVGTPR